MDFKELDHRSIDPYPIAVAATKINMTLLSAYPEHMIGAIGRYMGAQDSKPVNEPHK